MVPPSFQATSAGTISVAIWPGAMREGYDRLGRVAA